MKKREVHGGRHTRLYEVWKAMRQRCSNPNNKRYNRYGGRGITVCNEWDKSFKSFMVWAEKNGYAPGMTIERKDYNNGYAPDNCTFVTQKEQASNRSNNHNICFCGESLTIAQASKKYGVPYSTLRARLRRGWTDEAAITAKVRRIAK